MLKIQHLSKNCNVLTLSFSFNINGKRHQSNGNFNSRNMAEYYIRDCSHTLLSHALWQLIADINYVIPNIKSYTADQYSKKNQLANYANILLKKELEDTAKFISKYKVNILYIIPDSENKLSERAKEIISFSEITNQLIVSNKLLIQHL